LHVKWKRAKKGPMNTRQKNRLLVSGFLLFVIGFTCLMTFYAGPRMMAIRHEFAQDQFLFKCERVIDGSQIEVQLRGWERPNTNPVVPVRFAGIRVPPLAEADDPALLAWAEAHDVDPELASRVGRSAQRTLLAFIRKQNLFLYLQDGERSGDELAPGTPVHVFSTGTNVNFKLLESGLAVHDISEPHAHQERYAKAEAEARAEKRGLWL